MKEYDENTPLQYQQGKADFMGSQIKVDHRVLIPRPETELLVSVSGDLLREAKKRDPVIADIGTGSGAITVALAGLFKNGRFVASDISQDALDVARENIGRINKKDQVELLRSDMFSSFGPEWNETFDAVVSNPPYVSEQDYEQLDAWVLAEPKIALYAGKDGMDLLRIAASGSRRLLVPGGFAAVEVGYDQADQMKKEFQKNGFLNIKSFKDFNDHERVIVGWKRG